ncbi:MAG: hypothetical protein OXR67_08095 [Chloroflexota bacterium]|nr:hypothetical protein [Chloroflexota bacterium]
MERSTGPRRAAIVEAGTAGLGAAWAPSRTPNRFDLRVFQAQELVGGNAVAAAMPQQQYSSVPFDISVTACIPSVYRRSMPLLDRCGTDLVDTRFNYSVRHGTDV